MMNTIKQLLPGSYRFLADQAHRMRRLRHALRWVLTACSGKASTNLPQIFYGFSRVPAEDELVSGGMVKIQRLQTRFPNRPYRFNLLYLSSSNLPEDWETALRLAEKKKASIVLNQDGVAYPAWRPSDWEKINQPLKIVHSKADFVIYQSMFCKRSADHYLGETRNSWEILYNAVDTRLFSPAEVDPNPRRLVILIAGSHNAYYRLETALHTVAILQKDGFHPLLRIAGRLQWISDPSAARRQILELAQRLEITNSLDWVGPYTQQQAPHVLRSAHLLLHTQVNDASPGLVVEAMACGLPVVYSQTGGVPEIVGPDAGIGVPGAESWTKITPPDPVALAHAVKAVASHWRQFAEAARQRAVDHFDLQPWLTRHAEIFSVLLSKPAN